MKKLLILLFLCLPIKLWAACSNGVVAGVSPSVTAACNNSYSSQAVVTAGNNPRHYDLYYPTAWTLNNTGRTMVFLTGGGNMVKDGFFDHQSTQYPDFPYIASMGWNVYAMGYSVDFLPKLNGAITDPNATTVAITDSMGLADHYWPTSATPNFTVLFDSEQMTVTALGGGYSWTVVRGANSTVKATHTTGTYGMVLETAIPLPDQDIATFMSYLGQYSAGGTTPDPTTKKLPGNPLDIHLWGSSAGAMTELTFIMKGCATGAGCPYLNTTPGTSGYSEWSSTNWNIPRHASLSPIVSNVAMIKDTSSGSLGWLVAVMNCKCGIPSCSNFNSTTQQCDSGANACWTSCVATDNDLFKLISNTAPLNPPIPTLVNTGASDTLCGPQDIAFASLSVVRSRFYPGQGHTGDFGSANPIPSSVAMNDVLNFLTNTATSTAGGMTLGGGMAGR